MRKIILLVLVFMASFSFAAENEFLEFTKEIPEEIRGGWYTISVSNNQGATFEETEVLFYMASKTFLHSYSPPLKVIGVQKYRIDRGVAYYIETEIKVLHYIMIIDDRHKDIPILLTYENNIEKLRIVIEIKQ